jgi:phosphate transport system substrate-binding protein
MKRLPLVLLFTLILASCGSAAPPSPDAYPDVDGSSATLPMQRWTACHIHEQACRWERWETGFRAVVADNEKVEIPKTLTHSGTHSAYLNLIQGRADFILVIREPTEAELDEAASAGVTLDAQPVALDALVFQLHADNTIENLTQDELRKIYSGELTTWPRGSFEGKSITAYQRTSNNGSQDLMRQSVMGGTGMINSPELIVFDMQGPFHAIGGAEALVEDRPEAAGNPQGLGYASYFYATQIFPHDQVKIISIDGVTPTVETIKDGSYPLTTKIYTVVREDTPSDAPAARLQAWIRTDEAQEIIEAAGYIFE